MAKNASIEQYVAILKAVQRFANGATLKEIGAALTAPVQERDLREWINALITDGRVIREGEYKFARYWLAPGGLSGLEETPNQPAVAAESAAGNDAGVAGLGEAGRAGVSDPGYNRPGPGVAGLGEAGRAGGTGPVRVGRTVPGEPRLGETPPPTSARPATAAVYNAASARQTPYPPAVPAAPAQRRSPPPPPPPPAPPARIVTDEERARFKEYLDQLVPAIVSTEMKRGDARFYAGQAAEGLPCGDDQWFMEVIAAELDALDPARCAAYGIDPATFKKWRARW